MHVNDASLELYPMISEKLLPPGIKGILPFTDAVCYRLDGNSESNAPIPLCSRQEFGLGVFRMFFLEIVPTQFSFCTGQMVSSWTHYLIPDHFTRSTISVP